MLRFVLYIYIWTCIVNSSLIWDEIWGLKFLSNLISLIHSQMLGNKETTWLYIIIEVHFLNPYNHKSLSCMCCGCISSRYTGIQKIYIYLVLLPLNIYLLSILSFVKLNIPLYRSRLYQKSMMVLIACKYFQIFLTRFPEILPDSNRSMCQKPVKSNTRAHFCVFTVSYPRHVNKLGKMCGSVRVDLKSKRWGLQPQVGQALVAFPSDRYANVLHSLYFTPFIFLN